MSPEQDGTCVIGRRGGDPLAHWGPSSRVTASRDRVQTRGLKGAEDDTQRCGAFPKQCGREARRRSAVVHLNLWNVRVQTDKSSHVKGFMSIFLRDALAWPRSNGN